MMRFWPEWLRVFAAEVPEDGVVVVPIGTVTGDRKEHLDRLLARSFAPTDREENPDG